MTKHKGKRRAAPSPDIHPLTRSLFRLTCHFRRAFFPPLSSPPRRRAALPRRLLDWITPGRALYYLQSKRHHKYPSTHTRVTSHLSPPRGIRAAAHRCAPCHRGLCSHWRGKGNWHQAGGTRGRWHHSHKDALASPHCYPDTTPASSQCHLCAVPTPSWYLPQCQTAATLVPPQYCPNPTLLTPNTALMPLRCPPADIPPCSH